MRALTLIISAIAFIVLMSFLIRFRAKPVKVVSVAGEDWRPTGEFTHEASTGRTLRIWIDPEDGARYAVAEVS
jgi:hypothetical protein